MALKFKWHAAIIASHIYYRNGVMGYLGAVANLLLIT